MFTLRQCGDPSPGVGVSIVGMVIFCAMATFLLPIAPVHGQSVEGNPTVKVVGPLAAKEMVDALAADFAEGASSSTVDYSRIENSGAAGRALLGGRDMMLCLGKVSEKGLVKQESAWKPSARSHAGAVGLAQLMPGTARELGLTVNDRVDERLDPEKNVYAGAKYLKTQYDRLYEGKTELERWRLALAAYNWGRGNVNRLLRNIGKVGKRGTAEWCEIAPKAAAETRTYVKKILGECDDASGYAKEYGYGK